MAMNKKVLSALIGLVGAINNNGKTETTDAVIRGALLSESDSSVGEFDSCVDEIHREKFKISPGCATCQSPCGNTSDYSMEAFNGWTEEERALKEQIGDEILRIVGKGKTDAEPADVVLRADAELPDIVLKGISYIGYDLEAGSYRRLLEELKSYHF